MRLASFSWVETPKTALKDVVPWWDTAPRPLHSFLLLLQVACFRLPLGTVLELNHLAKVAPRRKLPRAHLSLSDLFGLSSRRQRQVPNILSLD